MKTRILLLLISLGALIVMLLAPDARADAGIYLLINNLKGKSNSYGNATGFTYG